MLASFSYTDFHACSSAVVLMLLDSILNPRLGFAATVGEGIETLEILAMGNEYAQRGVALVKRFCKMLSKIAPELWGSEYILSENQVSVPNTKLTTSVSESYAEGMTPRSSTVGMNGSSYCGASGDATENNVAHFGHHFEVADFAALDAIMGTDSELWDADQLPQDLYFFGFDGVGPGLT